MSTDVLGRVVEVASGMPLDKFIEERITKPLKMGDTGFEASADKKARGAKPMKEGPKNEVPAIPDITEKFNWRSGGGGMVSTAADYARFLQMFANGGQLVVTGQGESDIEEAVSRLAHRFPGQVGARIGFDDAEARAMFEASDFLLMPSRFEPCGLSQMYAQSLGALPIAYRTGGLVDTIEDGRSGFLFSQFDGDSLKTAVMRAFGTFRSKAVFRRMRRHAMSKKFGWSGSARRYATLYASMMAA